jgi:hypothetical protein
VNLILTEGRMEPDGPHLRQINGIDVPPSVLHAVRQGMHERDAEIEWLRGLLAEALDEWSSAHTAAIGYSHAAAPERIAEIRREAGLA